MQWSKLNLSKNSNLELTENPQVPGVMSLAVPGVPWQLTLFQPRGTDYAHLITTGTPRFSDILTALGTTKIYFYKILGIGGIEKT